MNKYLIIIGAGRSQLPLIEEIKKLSYNAIVIDRDELAPGVKFADIYIKCSTYDYGSIITHLDDIQDRGVEFVGVLARSSGPAIVSSAKISEHYSIPGISSKLALISTEKSLLNEHCKVNGIPVPKGIKINYKDFSVMDLTYPIIVKPDFPLVGKKNIKLVLEDLDFKSSVKAASKASFNKLIEVEEFIDGFDVACLFMLKNSQVTILSYWDELNGINRDGSIVGCGASVPSVIVGTAAQKKVSDIVIKFCNTLSDEHAILILSLRIDKNDNPYIIELHADLGGDLIADNLFPMATPNFNYFKMCVDFIVNKSYNVSPPHLTPTALVFDNVYGEFESMNRSFNLIKAHDLKHLHNKVISFLDSNSRNFLFKPGQIKMMKKKSG
jgi:biotin carboxylase